MNGNIPADNLAGVPWPTSGERAKVPDTSMLPGSERAPPKAVGLLEDAVRGAHDTLDRFAESAAPALRQLGDSVASAADSMNLRTDQLHEARDAWMDEARTTVRSNPLVALAAALALGVVIARLAR